MPIRFRCVYCNQKMGIARRKAGSVVNCPKCAGQLVVPQPADDAADADREPEHEPEPALVGGGASPAGPPGDITINPDPDNRPAVNGAAKPDSKNIPGPKPAGPSLFERGDIDDILDRDHRHRPVAPMSPAPVLSAPMPGPRPINPIDRAAADSARAPAPATSPAATPTGLLLTPTMATVLSVGIVLALAFSFAAGLVMGLMLKAS